MSLSFKGTVSIFAILICVSGAQLIYLSLPSRPYLHTLNHRQYRQDINAFVDSIKQHSAFAAMDPKRIKAITQASNKLLKSATISNSTYRLEQHLQQVLTELNDPSAAVQLPANTKDSSLRLPLDILFDGQYWQVFNLGGVMLDPDFPYLTHIDGLPMRRWVQASQAYLADSIKLSPQAQSQWIKQIARLRIDIGLRSNDETIMTFSNGDTSVQHAIELTREEEQYHNVSSEINIRAEATTTTTTTITSAENSQQHSTLRLSEQLDSATINALSNQLATRSAEPTSPLVIDIRAIKQPQPLFMAWLQTHFGETDKPQHIGILQYKRFATFRADRLPKRYIPISQLSFFEQADLKNQGFDIKLSPSSVFSDYLVRKLSPNDNSQPHLKQRLSEPHKLILLVDSSCEQECEWIALASQQWPSVELFGETTRGSLSPRYHVTLPNSGIELQFSQGVIYASNGRLVSGVGLAPAMPLNSLAVNDNNVAKLIAAQKSEHDNASSKGALAIVTLEKH
ncbi:hypothetical protein ACVBIL_19290 [Shewanella sp. 125m-7]